MPGFFYRWHYEYLHPASCCAMGRGVPVERPVVRNNAPSLSPAIISLGLHAKLKTKEDPKTHDNPVYRVIRATPP